MPCGTALPVARVLISGPKPPFFIQDIDIYMHTNNIDSHQLELHPMMMLRVEIALGQDSLTAGCEVEILIKPCATVDRHSHDVPGLHYPAISIISTFNNVPGVLATRRGAHIASMDNEGLAAPAVRTRTHPSLRNLASRGGQRNPRFASVSRA